MITKVTEVSGVEKTSYVGFSQGTSQLFHALAVNEPTINAKIDRAIMMAPCLYIDGSWNGLTATYEMYDKVFPIFQAENVSMFGSPNKDLDQRKIC